MDRKVEILIAIDARLKGLEQTIAGLKQTNTEAAATGVSLARLGSAAGAAFAGLGLGKAIRDGVQFNATLEQAALGIAAVQKQANPEKFRTFDAALAASASTIELLKQKAAESPATFEQLVQGLQGISGAASGANIPLKRQVDLVVMMSQALSGLGIRSEQILQESRALLTGNITEDAMAAKMLGATAADVAKAKESGQLFEYLTKKLDAFAEAGKRGQNTFTTAASNLKDAMTQLKGKVAEPIFAALSSEILKINVSLQDPAVASSLIGFGQTVASLVQMLLGLLRALIENADKLRILGHVALAAGTAFATLKFAGWVTGWAASARAIFAHTAALTADTAAATANATANNATRGRFAGVLGAAGIGLAAGLAIYGEAKLQEAEASALLRSVESRVNVENRAFVSLLNQVRETKELKAQNDLRAEIEKKVADLQAESAASNGAIKDTLDSSVSALQNILGRWKEIVGTAKEVALSDSARAEQQALLEASLGKELTLMRAKLNGQTEVVQRAEDEQRVLELVNKALKEGVKSRAEAGVIARQIVAAERESLALVESRRAEDRGAQTAVIGADLATRIRLKEEEVATLRRRRRSDAERSGLGALPLPPLPGAEIGGLQDMDGVLPKLDDIPTTPQDRLKLPQGPFGSSTQKEQRATTAGEIKQAEDELRNLRKEAAAERAESEKRITEFKERQLVATENERDPLKQVTTEAERQAAIAAKIRPLEEAHKADLESGKITKAEILALAEQEVRVDEIAAAAQKAKGEGLKEEKTTLKGLKEEYQEIARLIQSIESSPLIPAGSKGGLTNPLRAQLLGNLAAQSRQGEDTRSELAGLSGQQQQSNTQNSFGGQFQSGMVTWLDSLGTAGQNTAAMLTTSLGGAMDGLSEGIYGLITGTATWEQVWQRVGASVLQQLIKLGVQMLVQATIGQAIAAATAGTTAAMASGLSAMWATPAALAATASYGGAAAAGTAAVAGSIATIRGMSVLSGGFAKGGYTGDGGKFAPAGVVHRGEFVFTKEATANLGTHYLNSLHVSAQRGFATGGVVDGAQSVAASGGAGRPIINNICFSEDDVRRAVLNHPDAEHRFTKVAGSKRYRTGV